MTTTILAMWHGRNDQAKAFAIERAKELGGMVVLSRPPAADLDDGAFGYWSDELGMIRSWEQEVYRA